MRMVTVAILALVPAQLMAAQTRNVPPPATPGSKSITWNRMLKLSDGRTLVTDGALAIDAAIAKPAIMPATVLPPSTAKIMEGHMSAQLPDEFGLAQLSPGPRAGTYAAPSGILLNTTYVDFLRQAVPPAQLRFRMKGQLDPIVILVNGKPAGVLMAVAR